MEGIMEKIAGYHRLGMLCMVGVILCAEITLIVYKKMNIREVLAFFKRNKTWKKRAFFAMLCGLLSFQMEIPVRAVQMDSKIEPEEVVDLAPVLEDFMFYPGNEEEGNELTTEEELVFYAKSLEDEADVKIFVQIRDEQKNFRENAVILEYREEGQELWKELITKEQTWENPEENLFETVYLFDGEEQSDSTFEFRITYLDSSENRMIPGEKVMVEEAEEQVAALFLRQKLVIDKIAPVFEIVYLNETKQELQFQEESDEINPYYNAGKEITLKFHVKETNLDYEKTWMKISSFDKSENLLKEETLELTDGEMQKTVTEDGHYRVAVRLVDRAGNETIHEKKFALDYEPPKKPVIIYRAENTGILGRVINKVTFGYFAKEKIVAEITVEDTVSGVDKVTYAYEDVDTKELVTDTLGETGGSFKVELPFSFKGNLKVYSEDFIGNKSEEFQDIGVVAESEDTHQETAEALIKVVSSHSKTPGYYSGDVQVRFSAQDTYSGIQSISYLAGRGLDETTYYMEDTELITGKVQREYRILADEDNRNEIPVGMKFTDMAGHETMVSEDETPKIHIDTVSPKVWITYDNYEAENGKYFRKERTATVYVEERNFDPKDVEFDILGPEVKIGTWHHSAGEGCTEGGHPEATGHSDACVWKCEVLFSEDGDYFFGFSCRDLAGNEGSYGKTDEFVIDKTEPVIHVEYDNYDVKNELYYNTPRTAKITITDKNFRSDDVDILVNAENEGQILVAPAVSGWISSGDNHQATIKYDIDAAFFFDIAYTDLAGNAAEDYAGDSFIVDLTKPEIVISEIEDRSANNGIVSPMIMVTDTNYGIGSAWFELIGWQNGMIDAAKISDKIPNGEMIRIQDFSHVQEMDDLYQLTVGVEDLAGNVTEEKIRFSVNRFGSVYTLDKTSEKLVGENGSYFTTEEKDLVVTETNVDTLIFREIVCSHNGQLRTLKEGIDYTVRETGDETSWKQYQYDIKAENFAEEGHYIVTIYSEDRAKNLSNSQSKGKQLAFAVDKSAPSIVISGVENEGRYRENSRQITVDAQDNIALAKVQIILDGKVQNYDISKLQAANGKLSIRAESKNTWQTLYVYGVDKAGNEVSTEKISFLVTPNVLVQFYRNTPVFYGSMFTIGMILIGTCVLLGKRKKNEQRS